MILAFSMIMLTVSMTKNYNGRSYNSTYATVITNKEAISNKSIVNEALANDYIDNIKFAFLLDSTQRSRL